MLACALRSWFDHDTDCESTLWRALRDPVIVAAVTAIRHDPSYPWTATTPARKASVSRTTLNRRFEMATGEGPGAYLTQWRMNLAARRRRDTDDPIERIAADSGYNSVYAFHRAFRCEMSVPPARFRRAARTTA
ncbi:AraC family transcriptional regulator [Streptosporangium vulgare]|uniref:Helix-turn-helix domain-containing protein n=1 Tax=Streptosporangium vulgare TaxID=46190 RepID=A0ABV5TMV1_9ACTN